MKSFYYLLLLCGGALLSLPTFSQINETPPNRYVWDGKKQYHAMGM
jgi:hypothetical protein